jgi:hypothetical protein
MNEGLTKVIYNIKGKGLGETVGFPYLTMT